MEFKDTSGRIHKFDLKMSEYRIKNEEESRSKGQYELGQMLAQIYGRNNIVEDYPLPGCGNLSFDFWIPHKKIAFEIDGRQHKEFVKFFHKTQDGFVKQVYADARKQQIADMNSIRLYSIDESITKEELLELILGDVDES